MRRRLTAFTILAALLLAPTPLFVGPAEAANVHGGQEIVVAVFDTGIRADHKEFATGQVVAWWDFTTTRKAAGPAQDPYQNLVNGQVPKWDPFLGPYDDNGHGTATASLVGGANLGSCTGVSKTSYAPGVKLAILKVVKGTGVEGDLALAIRYAVDVLHADVLSLSLASIVPFPGGPLGDTVTEALAYARSRGALPVMAAGNGAGNYGLVPYPSTINSWGDSPSVLVVGSGSRSGDTLTTTTGNLDPEVSAWSDSVCVARHDNVAGYKSGSGTSYSAPLVAGMAATLMQVALANGHPADPDTIETILKHAARDTVAPYAREGWGFLSKDQFIPARAAAANGTLPTYTSYANAPVTSNAAYEAAVADNIRSLAGNNPNSGPAGARFLLAPAPLTGPGVIGPSAPAGAFEVELYEVTLAAGELFRFDLAYGAPLTPALAGVHDVDVVLYAPGAAADGILEGSERVVGSANSAGAAEHLATTASVGGTYLVAVFGWAITAPQSVVVSASAPLVYSGEQYGTGQLLSG